MDRTKNLLLFTAWIVLAYIPTPGMWLCAAPLSLPTASESNHASGAVEDAALHDVVFVDREYGWAVGDHGAILHTTDGGAHWHQQHSGTEVGLHGVSFIDRENGWVVGGETRPYLHTSQATVLRTTDGGKTWQSQLALIPAMHGVKFFDAVHGIAWGCGSGGEPLGVFVSDDSGRNWRSFAVGPAAAWWGGDFPNQRGGVVVGPNGQLTQLAHGDAIPIARETTTDIHAVRFSTAGTAWAVGANGLIIHSNDAGRTWQDVDVLPEDLSACVTWNCVATQGDHVWIAGSPGSVILHSPDHGKSWQGHATGNLTPIQQLAFVDDSHGWAVGALGTILQTNDGGQTWTAQQPAGERAAVLVLASDERDLPLATLAKLSGDGYRTVVHLLNGDKTQNDPTYYARVVEALSALGCNSVTQSSVTDQELILPEVVRQIRIWRPAVVIGPSSEQSSELDQQIADSTTEAVNQPAEKDQFPLLTGQLALPPWQVSRVFVVAGGETRGTHRVEYTAALPGTGQTLAEVATAARSLLIHDYTPSPETDEFQLQASFVGEPTASLDDLAAGLEISHGSDCRRPQPTALPFDAQLARRLAEKRRNLTNIVRFAEGNPALLSQVGQMTSDLDETAAAAMLFELAAQFRDSNQTQLAADTLNLLARRFPNAPITDQALTWLVQFYASVETAHAYRAQARALQQATATATKQSVQQATAIVEEDANAATAEFAQQRFTHAVQLVEHIAQTRPLLYAEPQIRVPWAMAERRCNSPDTADRYLASLAIRYPGDEWQQCGAVEQWLTDRTRPAPAKPRIDCRFTTDRPNLDGTLDEKCWQVFQSLAASATKAKSEITFAYDEQYLYLAIHCEKIADLTYSTESSPRTYDADLTEHDRVRVLIDVDRDYTTCFSLTVDHRGFTNDACWGDTSWNPKWFVAAGGDSNHWTVEAAIPWGELTPVAPTTGAAWAVSCERVIPDTSSHSQHNRVSPRDFNVLLLK